MCKKVLSGESLMNALQQAQDWANYLVRVESRGCDTDRAMRRVAARIGVSYTCLWRLRYRPPQDVFASVYQKLGAAYGAELRRQQSIIAHELEISRRSRPDSMLGRAAAFVAGSEASP